MKKALLLLAVLDAAFLAENAYAQTWVSTEPSLSLQLEYAYAYSTSDVLPDPITRIDQNGNSVMLTKLPAAVHSHVIIPTVDFTPIANLGLRFFLPIIAPAYKDSLPSTHPHPAAYNIDDGSFRLTLQDFNAEARYMIDITDVITITPFIGGSIPTHDYPTVGHAIVGRGRPALKFGLNIGRALSEVIPGAYFQARYQFALVKTLSTDAFTGMDDPTLSAVSINRSTIDFELGYFIIEDLSLHLVTHYDIVHGGISYTDVFNNPDKATSLNHDVLGGERYWLLGGGVTWIFVEGMFLSATYYKWILGANTHDTDAINLSVGVTIF